VFDPSEPLCPQIHPPVTDPGVSTPVTPPNTITSVREEEYETRLDATLLFTNSDDVIVGTSDAATPELFAKKESITELT